MPECHRCPYNGTGSRKCLKCAGPSDSPNHHGVVHVSIDALEYLRPVAKHQSFESMETAWKLEFARKVMQLRDIERRVLFAKMENAKETVTSLARRLKVSRVTVHSILRVLQGAGFTFSAIGRHEHSHGRPCCQADGRFRLDNRRDG